MPRARKGAARRQSKVRVLKSVKGYRGARGTQWRRVQEAAVRAGAGAYRDRRLRKRDFRRLWIARINAACRMRDIRYSQLINGLKLADVKLNRKMLSEIAIADPAGFDAIVKIAQDALAKGSKAAA